MSIYFPGICKLIYSCGTNGSLLGTRPQSGINSVLRTGFTSVFTASLRNLVINTNIELQNRFFPHFTPIGRVRSGFSKGDSYPPGLGGSPLLIKGIIKDRALW